MEISSSWEVTRARRGGGGEVGEKRIKTFLGELFAEEKKSGGKERKNDFGEFLAEGGNASRRGKKRGGKRACEFWRMGGGTHVHTTLRGVSADETRVSNPSTALVEL